MQRTKLIDETQELLLELLEEMTTGNRTIDDSSDGYDWEDDNNGDDYNDGDCDNDGGDYNDGDCDNDGDDYNDGDNDGDD